jgi:hypothetical protein
MLYWKKRFNNPKKERVIKKLQQEHLKLKTFIIEKIEKQNLQLYLNVSKLKKIWDGVMMLIIQINTISSLI